MNLDPRYLRSRSKLHAAIIKLASEQDPRSITVTSIAIEANVHRSTVYEHADSPEHLLRIALEAELAELYERLGFVTSSESDVLRVTLEYLESREAIFSRIGDESGTAIADTLSTFYVSEVLRMIEKSHEDFTPVLKANVDAQQAKQILIRAVCDAIVRVQGEWLQLEQPRDPHVALEFMHNVTPEWWPWD